MGKLAFLFAGQGAQTPGMGKTLYEENAAAKKEFDTVEAARPGTLQSCFAGTAEELAATNVTQPCVYAVDMACAATLRAAGVQPGAVAGFSLGEVAALTFAGVFSPADGARLVCARGEIMQEANRQSPGAMAAVLRLGDEAVEAICAGMADVWPVNYNCPGQIVVAGTKQALPAFCQAVSEAGGRARVLPVGGAFHTPLMQGAAAQFAGVLRQTAVSAPALPVYANRTALPYVPPYGETLAAQMHSPVRWHALVGQMAQDGYDTFVEVGPGKTLGGFVRRILPDAAVYNVQDAQSLAETLAALQNKGEGAG